LASEQWAKVTAVLISVGLAGPTPQGTELPIFGSFDQVRSHRVSLDITANHQEVLVVGNRKTLEA
jgi:hypothetical protein